MELLIQNFKTLESSIYDECHQISINDLTIRYLMNYINIL